MIGITKNINGYVAPHAGAWIETTRLEEAKKAEVVAPHAGAWIETFMRTKRA